jgi:hypothetical protein
MDALKLDVIDHRSWHPRGVSATLVNEIYCRDTVETKEQGTSNEVLEERINIIPEALEITTNQPETYRVKVQWWYPGVVEEVIERGYDKVTTRKKRLNLEERLLGEASAKLNQKQSLQVHATKEKTVEEIFKDMQGDKNILPPLEADLSVAQSTDEVVRKARQRRQKIRSTPVVGGGLFGETFDHDKTKKMKPDSSQVKKPGEWKPNFNLGYRQGHKASLLWKAKRTTFEISSETLKALRKGSACDILDSRGISVATAGLRIMPNRHNVVNQLQGYIRTPQHLGYAIEESDSESEASSMFPGRGQERDRRDDSLPPV